MNKTFFRAAAALLAVLCVVGCHRRPLYDPSEVVRIAVEVDVDNISNVTCDIYNPDPALGTKSVTTDMMRVMVYDPDTDKKLTEKFISDSLTLGARISILFFLQSAISSVTRVISLSDDVITAAIYSAG